MAYGIPRYSGQVMYSDRIDHVSSPRSHLLVLVMVRDCQMLSEHFFHQVLMLSPKQMPVKNKNLHWLVMPYKISLSANYCNGLLIWFLCHSRCFVLYYDYFFISRGKMCFHVPWFISIFFIVSSISIGLNRCSQRYANSEERAQSLSLTVLGSS